MKIDKTKIKRGFKKLGKWSLYTTYLFVTVLLLFEIAYRFQWIDFYDTELKALNSEEDLKLDDERPTMLIMGDSFTADPLSYVAHLRNGFQNYRIINAAIPGSGIKEANIIAPDRIADYQPDVFIYQIYEGNDLLDISHPTNWSELSFARNLYWSVSDYFLSLRYVNYKMAQVSNLASGDVTDDGTSKADGPFDPALYSARQKLYFQANPSILDDCRYLQNGRDADMKELLEDLNNILKQLPEDCKILIASIPHSSYSAPTYRSNMEQLGAKFSFEPTDTSRFFQQLETIKSTYPNAKVYDFGAYFYEFYTSKYQSKIEGEEILYYNNDPHLNEFGQQFTGSFLTIILAQHLKITPSNNHIF